MTGTLRADVVGRHTRGAQRPRIAEAGRRVRLPRGLFGTDRVDVGYEPWRAVAPTALRLGPSPDAPVVIGRNGPVELAADQRFGRQTTRNPGCLDRPPLRPAVDGFVWGYCMA